MVCYAVFTLVATVAASNKKDGHYGDGHFTIKKGNKGSKTL